MRSESIWTTSNVLSVLRILLAIPVCLLILRGEPADRMLALGLIAVAALTDFLDGYLARRFHQVTTLGRIMDPLADKVAAGAVAVILGVRSELPLWFVCMIVGRDVIILGGGAYIRHAKAITLESNLAGKIAVAFVAGALVLAIVNEPGIALLSSAVMAASALMLALSFVFYAKRFLDVMHSEP